MNAFFFRQGSALDMRLTLPLGRFGVWRLCLTRNMRLRRSQYRGSLPGHMIALKQSLRDERGDRCEICGRPFGKDVLAQLHHVLPYAYFPGLREDRRNLQVLCRRCHEALHHDPFRLVDTMQAKAAELGLGDVRRVYANPPFDTERQETNHY